MREEVCIVLNERESNKAHAAETLQKSLDALGIVSSRVEIAEGIEKLLSEKKPLILVLDYLLGDFSTGLDILHHFRDLELPRLPHFFFFTDEPSVQVAVEAMRLGAVNYFELDHPLSIDKLTREIASLLESLKVSRHREAKREHLVARSASSLELDDFIAQSNSSKTLLKNLLLDAKKPHPVYIVQGRPGAGASSICHLIATERADSAIREVISLTSETRTPQEICYWGDNHDTIRLGEGLTLIVEGLDFDDGEFFEYIAANQDRIWAKPRNVEQSPLIVCCHEERTASAWKKEILDSCVIKIPSLKDRGEDIPLLIQRFALEGIEISGPKSKSLDASTISWLSSLEWPGELAELRSAVIDATIALNIKDYIEDGEALKQFVLSRKDIWKESRKEIESIEHAKALGLSPLVANRVLEEHGFRPRAAAAYLGCTTRQLIKFLRLEESRE